MSEQAEAKPRRKLPKVAVAGVTALLLAGVLHGLLSLSRGRETVQA